jgi:hypothetical protein
MQMVTSPRDLVRSSPLPPASQINYRRYRMQKSDGEWNIHMKKERNGAEALGAYKRTKRRGQSALRDEREIIGQLTLMPLYFI